VEHLVLDFRMKFVEQRLRELKEKLRKVKDEESLKTLMKEISDMQTIRNVMAKKLGNNIIL